MPGAKIQDMFDITEADWDFILAVNTKGVFFVMQAVGREMIKRHSGKIVNTASISGKQPEPHFLHYGVSKAGVIHMTKSAAVVLAPYHINVNAICPGTTVTDMSLMATTGRAKLMGDRSTKPLRPVRHKFPSDAATNRTTSRRWQPSWHRLTLSKLLGRRSMSTAVW